MHYVLIAQLLCLVAMANTASLIAKLVWESIGRIRSIATSCFLMVAPCSANRRRCEGSLLLLRMSRDVPIVGLAWTIGLVVGTTAMAGDLFSSFLKRRLDLPPSSKATGLDQVPEC